MPVEVDIMVQVITINDVNLNDETVDINIALSMMWTDYGLAWDVKDFWGVKHAEVDPDLIWIPDLDIVNGYPISQGTKAGKAKIFYTGRVTFTRFERLRISFNPQISNYPFDKKGYQDFREFSWSQ